MIVSANLIDIDRAKDAAQAFAEYIGYVDGELSDKIAKVNQNCADDKSGENFLMP